MIDAKLCCVLLLAVAVGHAAAEHHEHGDHVGHHGHGDHVEHHNDGDHVDPYSESHHGHGDHVEHHNDGDHVDPYSESHHGHHVGHHGHGDHMEHHGQSGHRDGPHVSTIPASVTTHQAQSDDDDDELEERVRAFTEVDHRLDYLTSRMTNLHQKIQRRTDPTNIHKAGSFRARLMKLTGTGCDDRHFQCGGNDPECQSYLFVCDGHKDCRNGADEAMCELPTKKGDYFEGHMIWDTCTQRKPDYIGFEITSVTTSNFFTPLVMLHANMIMEVENPFFDGHVSLPTIGGYHLGRRAISFSPPESDRLALFCKFDGHNMNRCEGFIAHEATGNVCAEIIFVRKEHDEHH